VRRSESCSHSKSHGGSFSIRCHKNSSNCIVGCVTYDLKRFTPTGWSNNWCGRQNLLQSPECFQTFFIKFKRGLFGQQLTQGPVDLAEILDESPVEPCMAQEGTDFLHSTWGWKVRDQIYLCLVNLNALLRYDMPQYNPCLTIK
jgi:hypothetical protein